jgi:lysophospholipase L1-like esterase
VVGLGAVAALTALVVTVSFVVAAFAHGVRGTAGDGATASTRGHWVVSWTAMPQLTEPANMPPAPFTQDNLVLSDTTLRQTIRVSVGARQIRLRLSNAFGGAPLPITEGPPRPGRGPARGDRGRPLVLHFLSGLEVLARPAGAAVAMLGDSLTDGRGSTTNANNRWPDQLVDRLQARSATVHVAVANQAAGGNRVLNDGLGPNALARLDRDVLAQSGVRWLVVFEGINDIGTAEATEAAQKAVADDLITAYDQIITRAHAKGIRVYGATLTPFGGFTADDDPAGTREAARQAVNQWIRTSHRFDAVLDFDAVVRDPANPRRLLPTVDVGDHLHMNPVGYKLLADAVPLRLFAR